MHKNNITDFLKLQGVIQKDCKISEDLVQLWIELPVKEHVCPRCGNSTSRIHDYYERSFNHVKIGTTPIKIYYNRRRYLCTNCNKRFPETNSFIERFYRHSNSVVNKVFDELKDIRNLSQIGKDNNMSSQNVTRLMCKFMPIFHNVTSLPEAIGIDELDVDGFKQLCNMLDCDENLRWAYSIIQNLFELTDEKNPEKKLMLFKEFITYVSKCDLPEFNKHLDTYFKWHKYIINSFSTEYNMWVVY